MSSTPDLIYALLKTDNLYESQRFITQHQKALLSDEADAFLGFLLRQAQEDDDISTEQMIKDYRVFLKRCREVGVARALAEKTASGTMPVEFAQVINTLPPELFQELLDVTEKATDWASFGRELDNHPKLAAALKRSTSDSSPQLGPDAEAQIPHLLMTFVDIESWSERGQFVEQNQTILLHPKTDEALARMMEFAQEKDDIQNYQFFTELRTLLKRCRQVGIKQAFAEKTASSITSAELTHALDILPPELIQQLSIVLDKATDWASVERKLANHPDLVAAIKRAVSWPLLDPSAEAKIPFLLKTFADTKSLSERQQFVEQNQTILLHPKTDELLARMIKLAQKNDDSQIYQDFTELRTLFERCRQVGIKQAFMN